jgi:hypothetical protein
MSKKLAQENTKRMVAKHKGEMLTLKTHLENALVDIKSAPNGVELVPYGVKLAQKYVGLKCVFMNSEHVGVWEDKLLELFLIKAGFGASINALKFVPAGSKTGKKGKTSKVLIDKGLRYKIVFENRQFKVELLPQYVA